MLNVANDLTKGILVEEMNGRWFNRPKFLQQGQEFWPVEQGTLDFKEVNKEKRKGQITRPASVNTVIDRKKFSTWKRLLKVTAYVIRFCNNLCNKTHQDREGSKSLYIRQMLKKSKKQNFGLRSLKSDSRE